MGCFVSWVLSVRTHDSGRADTPGTSTSARATNPRTLRQGVEMISSVRKRRIFDITSGFDWGVADNPRRGPRGWRGWPPHACQLWRCGGSACRAGGVSCAMWCHLLASPVPTGAPFYNTPPFFLWRRPSRKLTLENLIIYAIIRVYACVLYIHCTKSVVCWVQGRFKQTNPFFANTLKWLAV